MNIVDQAIIDWANDQLEKKGLSRDAKRLRFGYELGCYSSWTCDYNVTATVQTSNGGEVELREWLWPDVLTALPEYVVAAERMYEAHAASHNHSDGDYDTTVTF